MAVDQKNLEELLYKTQKQLNELQTSLNNIIKIKEKAAANASSSVMFSQERKEQEAVENFGKIYSQVLTTIQAVKQIYNAAQLASTQRATAAPTAPGMGLGGGTATYEGDAEKGGGKS